MKRVQWSNILAVLLALYLGRCTAVEGQAVIHPDSLPALVFRGLQPFVPGALERGIWYEVESCLQKWDVSPDDLRWGVAHAIVDVYGRQLLWGVNSNVSWDEGAQLTIVIDEQVKNSARVLSHEMIHFILDVPDGDWHLNACTIYDGPYSLPLRPLTDDQIAALLGLGAPG